MMRLFGKKDWNYHDFNTKTKSFYDEDGYDIRGYDKKGYDKKGFDIHEFNIKGIHKKTKAKFDEDGYDKYVERCKIRTYDNLLWQFTCANLGRLPVTQPALRNDEYIISASDDDCEDGVCKL